MYGTNHQICGNNVNGTVSAEGTCSSNASNSLLYKKQPLWWNASAGSFPPIGFPNTFSTNSNPAKIRYESGGIKTFNANAQNAPALGSIRFNTATNKLEGYTGREWDDLH